MELVIGSKVKALKGCGRTDLIGRIGTVLGRLGGSFEDNYLVSFEGWIGGHDGAGHDYVWGGPSGTTNNYFIRLEHLEEVSESIDRYIIDRVYQEGEKVKVLRRADSYENDWEFPWVCDMNTAVGQVLIVEEDKGTEGVRMEDGYCYPHFVLELVKNDKEDMRPFYPVTVDRLGGLSVGDIVEIQDRGKLYKSWPEAYSYFGFTSNVRSSSNNVEAYEIGTIKYLFVHPKYPDRNIAVVKWDDGGYAVVNTVALSCVGHLEETSEKPTPTDDIIRVDVRDKVDMSFIHKKESAPRRGELEVKQEQKVKL